MSGSGLNDPLTREEAFALSTLLWGYDGCVGINHNYRRQYHVGAKGDYGVWRLRGVGNSWEEAFLSVEPYPDGALPRTHGARKAPDAF